MIVLGRSKIFQGLLQSVIGGDLTVERAKLAMMMLRPTRLELDDALRTFPLVYRSQLRSMFDGFLPQSHEAPSLQERGQRPPLLRQMRGGTNDHWRRLRRTGV